MRAATALVSLLQGQSTSPVWRADEIARDGAASIATGFAALDAELPGGGWPQGQLVELLLDAPGVGELSLLAPALARIARDRPCVWVLPCDAPGANALPYPPALAEAGIAVARSIFVQPATPRESLWALEQSLRTAHLGALIGWLPAPSSRDGNFRALRRLHLLAQRHRALVFLLRAARAADAASPASLRLRLACADGKLHVTVLKRRGRLLLEPVVLQVHPAHWNEARIETRMPAPPDSPGRIVINSAPALPARRWSLQSIFSH
jgi:cell division inhibitor SulA/protein ImuA